MNDKIDIEGIVVKIEHQSSRIELTLSLDEYHRLSEKELHQLMIEQAKREGTYCVEGEEYSAEIHSQNEFDSKE